jgi:surface protein
MMSDIFSSCQGLTKLDLGSWTTGNVKQISYLFNALGKVKYVDISNFKLTEDVIIFDMFYNVTDFLLTDIGMVHCDVETINIVASLTPVQPITIWIGTHLTAEEIASLDQYDHITYSVQVENAERLLLSSPLLEGDEIKVVDGQLCHVHNMTLLEVPNSTYIHNGANVENNMYYVATTVFTSPLSDVDMYNGIRVISNWKECRSFSYSHEPFNHIYLDEGGRLVLILRKEEYPDINAVRQRLDKEPLQIIIPLETPYTEVIDLPRANIDVELYENGVLYMSDPTASTNRVDSDGNMIIDAIQGDSVVNVSNQQFSIELSEETNAPIQTGEITDDNAIRPKFYGRTMVNLMDRINWSKYIEETKAGYSYESTDITAKYITITNFNDKPIYVQINNIADNTGVNSRVIAVNETVNININETSYLAGIYGLVSDGWNGINIHEITNVNIFEGELSEDELPENRMSGMRNAFDKYQTSEGKYRVEMVVSNSPIQFGKAGRK